MLYNLFFLFIDKADKQHIFNGILLEVRHISVN